MRNTLSIKDTISTFLSTFFFRTSWSMEECETRSQRLGCWSSLSSNRRYGLSISRSFLGRKQIFLLPVLFILSKFFWFDPFELNLIRNYTICLCTRPIRHKEHKSLEFPFFFNSQTRYFIIIYANVFLLSLFFGWFLKIFD